MEQLPAQIRTKRKRRIWLPMFLFILLLAAGFGSAYYYMKYWPSSVHEAYSFGNAEKPVFYRGNQLADSATGAKEGLKLTYRTYKEIIDPTILYEEESQSVIVTTKDKVVRMRTSELTALVNEKPITLRFAVEKQGQAIMLPIDPLKQFYHFEVRESEETGAVLLRKAGDLISWASVVEDGKHPERTVPLRKGPSIKAPIYYDVSPKSRVMLWGEEQGWYRVQLENGYLGYMKKSDLILAEPERVPEPELPQSFVPWKPVGGKINLTWQQVYSKNPDTSKIPPMPGVNVISPQWFHLADGEGNLKHTADAGFVKWANDQGYQVWALFANGFDPKRTTEALSTYDKRLKMIKQLVAYSQMYKIQGINIDFENVYLKDKANMVQFVREATPYLHELGLVVSIDVTVKDGSETYSLFLDRKAIGEVVDYMMVMTYDEHWAASPKAGSVASLPWVEKGMVQIMKEDHVPASKLLLGVPFYTRIWTETTKDGKTTVSSKAVGMDAVDKIIKDRNLTPIWDEAAGQNYVEYTEDGKRMKIWIEDSVSMKSRIELVRKYDLAGVASWSRGFEKPEIWNLIKENLEKKP